MKQTAGSQRTNGTAPSFVDGPAPSLSQLGVSKLLRLKTLGIRGAQIRSAILRSRLSIRNEDVLVNFRPPAGFQFLGVVAVSDQD